MELRCTLREEVGSRSAKRLRKEGIIPAVIYGKGNHLANIKITYKDFNTALKTLGRNGLFKLVCPNQSYISIIKEVDHDLIHNRINHISFQEINATEKLQVSIPLVLTGEFYSHSGILEQRLNNVLVECLATKIPRNITLDTSNLNIGDIINVKDIVSPEDVVILTAPDILIGSIVKPQTTIDVTTDNDEDEDVS